MRRFRILFIICTVALLAPLALLIERALHSVTMERQLRHQTVAERVFDEMERALSRLLADEEQRPIAQYAGPIAGPSLPFVIGHFQIDAAGTVRAITAARPGQGNEALEQAVTGYWRRGAPEPRAGQETQRQVPGTTQQLGKSQRLDAAPEGTEEHEADSDVVSAFDALRALNKGVSERPDRQRGFAAAGSRDETRAKREHMAAAAPRAALPDAVRAADELPAMVGRVIDAQHVLLYRTVAVDSHLERQGLLLEIVGLTAWLRDQGLGDDGLSAHGQVDFTTSFDASALRPASASAFVYQHRFAEPFEGLSARLMLQPLPGLGSTTYVYALCALVLASVLIGLAALYRMVAVVLGYAERRSNFVAAVSHELKTPLTAIRMYGEMLRDGMVPSDAKCDEYYRHITTESERLSRLINNVLELARIEKGTRDVALIAGPVTPVLDEIAELARPHLAGHGFTLQVTSAPDVPPVRYERDALMQVLWNLIDNAVKYAGSAARKQIELRCERAGDRVVLSVRDHGSGVPPRHLAKIFEPFYRSENELTRRTKGTGIGLALVRGLAERMGATVSGRNVPDGGFEVQVAFRPA